MKINKEAVEFQWEEGNIGKNKTKHDVMEMEAEETFIDRKRFIFKDHIHSNNEERFRIMGKTKQGRLLFVVFTIRRKKIRIISARDTNRKEELLYEKKINTSII
ncbi:hypothetical protein AUK04_00440 [Candidatus Roizmanbacteria bacterium CG2_30_33_16]|uniref:BrnT family toxin n=4 Tax=Candidatus Roizmaniibacteriota TaxID=1752723 RepID=A0A2H0C493_9BACT|nr:BrnT family toxin [Candidatus Roizmanbacteria bacterium]OIP86559.1 MAG: hypothetical protein AUK04_00440 [Candidatus Roizmanbacteria bacterium CG2_30_33_16]PIP64170.1 MAG: hypothetical protein COW96_04065 [Candidatus Roizmanbacteria bacterium CG22_combo_CG10-13_8_21_14_all_33_16]PIX70759.1 MAG: hypothetical protein COZ39_04270 [Candidatus Roizmanbacteria bacterium CG_4_10_14_3_um_filter_33_21]PJB88001.1 MAG: hypothetical protein CO083_03955 [Candidatus Roizmanbacteria bacterium CG_4_9_14_0_8